MPKHYHCHFAIRTVLDMEPEEFCETFGGCFYDPDTGRQLEPFEVRILLLEQINMGRKVLPIGACSNFDYQKGCQGHE